MQEILDRHWDKNGGRPEQLEERLLVVSSTSASTISPTALLGSAQKI
ncbi:hypothetical protein M5X11_20875 [Paenibacillus alginolyticus]|uniref:Uncharacterized protein n=1 Tax=Paenibacillus alginolyticus TaxID=59839 RepID=A0ABT4GMU1_9BACL|nr:hypothetical protein [Paenibacillus alginolyticus]MCY9667347.1 hypothetical protein [Paenibacillus alginolyticus]MCY9697497.1 hypothetical protein [Paenibacillus alginolyticus]MEC0141963.1 hypothetical protein [Paenibacillus alginolyticus]